MMLSRFSLAQDRAAPYTASLNMCDVKTLTMDTIDSTASLNAVDLWGPLPVSIYQTPLYWRQQFPSMYNKIVELQSLNFPRSSSTSRCKADKSAMTSLFSAPLGPSGAMARCDMEEALESLLKRSV